MRSIISGGSASDEALLLSGGLAVLYILLAGLFFTRTFCHAVRTGLLARYSAENVA